MGNQQMQHELYEVLTKNYYEQRACINAMKGSKAFKLAYLATRFNWEFIRGNWDTKKKFVKWLIRRKDPRPISEMHYVLRMELALDKTYHTLQRVFPEVADAATLAFEQSAQKKREEELERIEAVLAEYEGKRIVLFPEVVDWNIPLFQRPQQLAMAFAQENVLFIYVTPNYQDKILGITKVQDYCYLITKEYMLDVLKMARKHEKETVLEIYSTDNIHSIEVIDYWKKYCDAILYEYIDEISAEITGTVPKLTMDRHEALLKDESVYVVATADKLYQEVIDVRGSDVNTLNSGNGVDCKHFTVEKNAAYVPSSIRPIIEKKKPIIGYFGAIANWFDFELIAYAAKQKPEYEFLMIGPRYGDHDMSILEELKRIDNLHFVGTVDYKILPYVANYFSVATIPFKINEITESTSPIKLFEYMAMGKPCVTTAMRECFKYQVVKAAKTQVEYVKYLDWAVEKCNDEQFINQLKNTADQNSWNEKAKEILRLINKQN